MADILAMPNLSKTMISGTFSMDPSQPTTRPQKTFEFSACLMGLYNHFVPRPQKRFEFSAFFNTPLHSFFFRGTGANLAGSISNYEIS